MKKYNGFIDNIVDNMLEKYGISEKMIKDLTAITENILKNVSVEEYGDETFVTIHLSDINLKFNKKAGNEK